MLIGHKKQWKFLTESFKSGQMSHAYIFEGLDGIGKKYFAKEFAEFAGCRFPDLLIIEEANKKDYKFGDGGEVTIAQIRKVQEFLSYKAYNGLSKMVIVDGAEKMNAEAQNCFLKTLEEPKGNSVIILITSKPGMLLPTILSRCQTIKFLRTNESLQDKEKTLKEQAMMNDFLEVAGMGIAEKFKFIKSIDFETTDPMMVVDAIKKCLRHALLIKEGIHDNFDKEIDFKECEKIFKNYSQEKLKKLLNLIEDVGNKISLTNVNPKLALEILLMEL